MKRLIQFFKTSLIGGLFVLLPLVLFYLLLAELLEVVVLLATPIADFFPAGTFDEVKAPVVIAVLLIIGASFLLGLTLRSTILRRIGHWIEGNVLGRLPLYNAVKRLGRGLAGAQEDTAFQPAIFNSSDGVRELVYLIEDHGDGNATILVPWAPASFAGSIKIIKRDRIEVLETNVGEASRVLAHWGVGTRDLLEKKGGQTI